MLNIKKYSNGRFFDTATKEYIKPEKLAELIKKGEEIQVILTKTGKDITDAVIGQLLKKEEQKKEKQKKESSFLATDKLVKWLGEIIDTKIEQVMDVVKLPTREQVANLDKNIKELNKKIDALTLSRENATTANAASPDKTVDAAETTASKAATPGDKKPSSVPPVAGDKKETSAPSVAGDKKNTSTPPDTENKKPGQTTSAGGKSLK
jgi:hypothetical protein